MLKVLCAIRQLNCQ